GRHQAVCYRVHRECESAAEDAGLEVLEAVNVRLSSGRVFIPDLVLVPDIDRSTFEAAEVALIGEVVSPSNAGHDRVLEFHLYAEAGIPWYLLVEPDGDTLALTLYRLEDGGYVEHTVAKGGQPLTMTEPIEVTIDPARLLRR